VSNYAKRGKESVHNDHYWDGGLYLGAGAGAFCCQAEDGIRYRYANTPSTGSYLASPDGLPREGIGEGAQLERLGGTDVARELVMLGLRRREGVDVARVLSLVSPSLQPGFENGFCTLVDEGYATRQNQRIVPTAAGMILADELALRFF